MGNLVHQDTFWAHIKRYAGWVSFIDDAVTLYFCMADEVTPGPIKALIAAAFVYFVLPSDAIPDWLPLCGWADDAAVMASTLTLVETHITSEHRRKARAWITEG